MCHREKSGARCCSYLSKVKENRSTNRFYDLHGHLPFGFIRDRNFHPREPGLLAARPRHNQLRKILIPLWVWRTRTEKFKVALPRYFCPSSFHHRAAVELFQRVKCEYAIWGTGDGRLTQAAGSRREQHIEFPGQVTLGAADVTLKAWLTAESSMDQSILPFTRTVPTKKLCCLASCWQTAALFWGGCVSSQ